MATPHLKNYDYSKKDMENINMKFNRRQNTLTIIIDLNHEMGDTKSGKNILVATTKGPKKVKEDPDIFCGINCYKRKD